MKEYGYEEWDEEMNVVQNCIKPNLQRTKSIGAGVSKIKVTQNVKTHTLLLDFLKSDEIFENGKIWQLARTKQTTNCNSAHTYKRTPQWRDKSLLSRKMMNKNCTKM